MLPSVWLGARDNTTEGTWTWSSDSSTLSSIAFNKWTGAKTPTTGNKLLFVNENIHNFPIRLHQELCRADNCRRVGWREVQHSQVIMSPEATLSIWHYFYRGYVCKKPDKTQTALPTVTCPVKQLCDAGWVSWGTSCYMMSASATTVMHTLTLEYCIDYELNFYNRKPSSMLKIIALQIKRGSQTSDQRENMSL